MDTNTTKKRPSGRPVKLTCSQNPNYIVSIARRRLEGAGAPSCPCCGHAMIEVV